MKIVCSGSVHLVNHLYRIRITPQSVRVAQMPSAQHFFILCRYCLRRSRSSALYTYT